MKATSVNPLVSSPSLLIKLGSIARHVEEMLSLGGHDFDRAAIDSLLGDPEVVEWMTAADGMALLPVRRDAHPPQSTG